LIPQQWLLCGAAVGSVEHCMQRLDDYLAAGADEILLHGTTCQQQQPLIEAVQARR
jgi:5,10-methylenetetrahydromethanopterin reductase